MTTTQFLEQIAQRKHEPQPPGAFSICSANPFVLKTSMALAKSHGFPLIIETTCNQVNQFGGYTGLTPAQFVSYVSTLAKEIGLGKENVILGGDHLGPFAWKNELADSAMQKSIQLVTHYVRAGYKKIHLDASVSCLDDLIPLPKEVVVERECVLCSAAVREAEACGQNIAELAFVVGTEVPMAGGSSLHQVKVEISSVGDTEENISLTEKAFINHKLEAAWRRTFAFVVQPGVEFSGGGVQAYDRQKAEKLSKLIEKYDHLVFEAHSTDYQSRSHLRQLVEDHFAFLKVGPALTYALREALFALSDIEIALLGTTECELSNLKQVLDGVMVSNPVHWVNYYFGDQQSLAYQRKYSILDRSRYYLAHPDTEKSVDTLLRNLSRINIPTSLLHQHFPEQFTQGKDGQISNEPFDLIAGKISVVITDYINACFPDKIDSHISGN